VYGSSALLDFFRQPSALSQALKKSGTHILFDLCQNLYLREYCRQEWSLPASFVFSFNNKTIPGVMGAVVMSNVMHDFTFTALPGSHRRIILKAVIRALVLSLPKSRQAAGTFDHSTCENFPFEIVPYKPASAQLLLAWIRLFSMKKYLRRKKKFIATHAEMLRKTPHHLSSPYLMADAAPEGEERRIHKSPYAMPGNHAASAHPDLLILHNKGFADTI
jgi:hypothetical protein